MTTSAALFWFESLQLSGLFFNTEDNSLKEIVSKFRKWKNVISNH